MKEKIKKKDNEINKLRREWEIKKNKCLGKMKGKGIFVSMIEKIIMKGSKNDS